EAKAAKAEAERQQTQAAEEAAEAQWRTDVSQVMQTYGDSAKDNGPLGKAMIDEYDKAAQDPKHPFHALWNEGRLSPIIMAPYVAASLGITPRAAAPAPVPVTPPTPAPRVLPVPGGARTA